MNDSLHSFVDNLTCNLYKKKCKHYMKYKDCKKSKKSKDDGIEWCEICTACKKLLDYCKDCNKNMMTVNIILNTWK